MIARKRFLFLKFFVFFWHLMSKVHLSKAQYFLKHVSIALISFYKKAIIEGVNLDQRSNYYDFSEIPTITVP